MKIKRLSKHSYFVRLDNNEVNICGIDKTGGIQMFAGQISWEPLKYPVDVELLSDINDAFDLNLTNDEAQPRSKHGA